MRSLIATAAIALASLVAAPAFAAPADVQGNTPNKTQTRSVGDRGDEGNTGDKGKGKHFPMPAAEFKAKVDARMAKARQRMEERAKDLPADQAKELRAKFDAAAAKVNAEVAKAVADGTVTKDEAKAVRQASPHHGKHGKGGKHARKGGGAPRPKK